MGCRVGGRGGGAEEMGSSQIGGSELGLLAGALRGGGYEEMGGAARGPACGGGALRSGGAYDTGDERAVLGAG